MTTLDLSGLVRPHLVEMTKREDNPNAAEFRLQPLERGYGYTLGNSLRRMLLSSLRGAAVWAFRLDGVVHEHQTIPGVVEDVHQIIQRLKQLTLVLDADVDEAVLHIRHDKAGAVYARDIEAHAAVSVVNPDQLLFTLQDDREVAGELYVNKGRGYVEAEQHPVDRTLPVDVVRIDSIYNPVRRANFTVAETRVGQRTDYDRLTLSVETNGTISPEDAVAYAAALAQEHFRFFVDFGKVPMVAAEVPGGTGSGGRRARGLAGALHRRPRPVRPVGEFAQEFQYPDARRPRAVQRGRSPQGEERRGEGPGRNRGSAAARRAQLRHALRGGRRRRAGDRSRHDTDGARHRRRGGLVRHRAKHRQLSRTASHRKALLANLAASLFRHDRIETTEAKAKELRPYAERLITLARRGDLHARRLVERRIKDREITHRLFAELGKRFAARPGGYTRIVKLGHRAGDGADVARIELLSE